MNSFKMIKPIFKRFRALFISIIIIMAIGTSIVLSFVGSSKLVNDKYNKYMEENNLPDLTIEITTFEDRNKILNKINSLDGVSKADARFARYITMKTPSGHTTINKILSYDKNKQDFLKLEYKEIKKNVNHLYSFSVESTFAHNNNIKAGDYIEVGYNDIYFPVYVESIVSSPETLGYSPLNTFVGDNVDFGYFYIEENSLKEYINNIKKRLDDNNITLPSSIISLLTSDELFNANQFLIDFDENALPVEMELICRKLLNDTFLNISSSVLKNNHPSKLKGDSSIRSTTMFSYILPGVFFFTILIVLVLFLNQIIGKYSREIGILGAMGYKKKSILGIFSLLILVITLISSLLGIILGIGIETFLLKLYSSSLDIPRLSLKLDIGLTLFAVLITIAVGQLAAIISSLTLFRLTPTLAMTNANHLSIKEHPKLDRALEKLPKNLRLGLNTMIQNPKRVFVTFFSIISATVMVSTALFFNSSIKDMINSTFDERLNYDAQIFLANKNDTLIEELSNIPSVKKVEYAPIEGMTFKHDDVEIKIAVEGIESNTTLLNLYDKNHDKITDFSGFVIDLYYADKLNVEVGDEIYVNDVRTKISGISRLNNLKYAYTSNEVFNTTCNEELISYFVESNDIEELSSFIANNYTSSIYMLTSDNLRLTFEESVSSISTAMGLVIAYSLFIGFVVITIMAISNLDDTKHQLSIMRAIGFKVRDVSNLYLVQTISTILIGCIIGIPLGYLFTLFTCAQVSYENIAYFAHFTVGGALYTILFVSGFVLASHLFSIRTIKKWNLVSNVQSRE